MSESQIGIMFGMYYLGLLICSLKVGKDMGTTEKKKNYIIQGLMVIAFGNMLFLLLTQI